MSTTTVIGVTPGSSEASGIVELAKFANSYGWAPAIWTRMLEGRGMETNWFTADGQVALHDLWKSIDDLDFVDQVALLLTFDTGIIPRQAFEVCADALDEFERRSPSPLGYANHVPVVAALLRTDPDVPWIGVWGTSVTHNPLGEWNEDIETTVALPLDAYFILPLFQKYVDEPAEPVVEDLDVDGLLGELHPAVAASIRYRDETEAGKWECGCVAYPGRLFKCGYHEGMQDACDPETVVVWDGTEESGAVIAEALGISYSWPIDSDAGDMPERYAVIDHESAHLEIRQTLDGVPESHLYRPVAVIPEFGGIVVVGDSFRVVPARVPEAE